MNTFEFLEAENSKFKKLQKDTSGRSNFDYPSESHSDALYNVPNGINRDNVAKMLAEKTISPSIISGIITILEILTILVIGTLCVILTKSHSQESTLIPAMTITGIAGLYVMLGSVLNLNTMQILRVISQQMVRMIAIWMICFSTIILSHELLPTFGIFNKSWISPWFAIGFIALAILRLMVGTLVKSWTKAGLLERRAIIVGGGKEAEEVITGLERQPNNDIRICGIFDDRTDERSPDLVAGYPKLGTVPELVEFARSARLDMLIVSLPLTAGGRVREMLKKLWVLPVDIRLSAHTNKMAFKQRAFSYIGAMPFVKLADRPISGWHFVRKRIFDTIISATLLILLMPLMVVTAIAIKLDSKGPVFFRQKRHGFNNEIIDVWKFRSMYSDKCDPAAKVVVTKSDSRVTHVGAFIRKTSLDELPQLWNVLLGELSLVGPRPHAVHAHLENQPWNEVVDGYFARHRVKPGVTGWAQINGWRGEVDNVEKIKKRTDYDLYYIENWSLAFDLYILAMTPIKLMDTNNAY